MNVKVIVLTMKTRGDTTRGYKDNLELVGMLVGKHCGVKKTAVNKEDVKLKTIVVAPEYMYAQYTNDKYTEPIDSAAAEEVKNTLKSLSEIHRGTLIVGGTMYHIHPKISTEKDKKKFKEVMLRREMSLKYRGDVLNGMGDKKTTGKLKETGNIVRMNYDENTMLTFSEQSEGAKKKITGTLKELNEGTLRIIRNSVVIAYEGKVMMVDKTTGFGEVPAGIAYNDYRYGCLAWEKVKKIGGVNMGFEVCFEHDFGILKKRSGNLTLHILLSDTVENNEKNIGIGTGGYLIHSSTCDANSCVYKKKTDGKYERCGRTMKGKIGSRSFSKYSIEIPEAKKIDVVDHKQNKNVNLVEELKMKIKNKEV